MRRFDEGVKEILTALAIGASTFGAQYAINQVRADRASDIEKIRALRIANQRDVGGEEFERVIDGLLTYYVDKNTRDPKKVHVKQPKKAYKYEPFVEPRTRSQELEKNKEPERETVPPVKTRASDKAPRDIDYRDPELKHRDRAVASNTVGKLVDFIKQFEGFHPKRYWDHKQWSIGYGTKAKPGETTITQQEAEQRLMRQIKKRRALVEEYGKQHGYNWTNEQINALTSFHYNLGSIKRLTQNGTRSDKQIAKKILAYHRANGKPLTGLKKRRKAEQQLFIRGEKNQDMRL